MRRKLKRYLPDPARLRSHRWLRWLGPALGDARIWQLSRRGVAFGCAIGVFFGLLVPVAQIPLSAGAAVLLRVNLPAAVASTLVSNPLTFGPLYYTAYRLGSAVTGETAPTRVTEQHLTPRGQGASGWLGFWWQRLAGLGKPLVVGLGIMAPVASVVVYMAVIGLWRLAVLLAWTRRRRRRGD